MALFSCILIFKLLFKLYKYYSNDILIRIILLINNFIKDKKLLSTFKFDETWINFPSLNWWKKNLEIL